MLLSEKRMKRISNPFIILTLLLGLQACSTVDEYLLGKDNTPSPLTLTPVSQKMNIAEKWSVIAGKSSSNNQYLKLKPVIDKNEIFTADNSGIVQASNKHTGQSTWVTNLAKHIVSGPAVSQGYIAIGTDTAQLIVLDQNSGKQVWRTKVSGDILAKPLILQNKILAKTIDGNLYAFNLSNGEKLWSSTHGAPNLILKASSSPVAFNNYALVGFSDGKLDAVELSSGNVSWQRSIAFASGSSDVERLVDIDADPVVENDVAYLATYQGYIGAMSLTDGQFIWRKPASTYKNIATDAGTVYMTDANDIIWAYGKKDGQVKWKQEALKYRGVTEPVLLKENIVVADKQGIVHILSSQNGEIVARTKLNAPVYSAPTTAGNTIFVMTSNGKLTRLNVS
jgi:outer membrane protein assembly factor BamB